MFIYCNQIAPRLQYIADLLSNRWGIAIILTTNNQHEIAINYSNTFIQQALQIHPSTLLFSQAAGQIDFENTQFENMAAPFKQTENTDFNFDIFAAIFYLVTRYEEYLPHKQNQYGQFQAKDSWAYKNNVLALPIVDIWIEALKVKLEQTFPDLSFKKETFTYQFTYDIDTAYYFAGKPLLKNIALLIKDAVLLRFDQFAKRKSAIVNAENDIANTYDYIIDSNKNHVPILFFLLGDKHPKNGNLPHQSKLLQQIINAVKNSVDVGIHPSYESPRNKRMIAEEKSRLEQITGNAVTKSRQHFLRFYMPTTYNHLIACSITHDYTMGYAELPGFRASTCKPFKFYDVVNDISTNLTIHPTTFMEGTFAEDLQMQSDDALLQMKALINEVKKVNGNFICIWHNHSLSDYGFWKGWREVHEALISEMQ